MLLGALQGHVDLRDENKFCVESLVPILYWSNLLRTTFAEVGYEQT